MTSNPPGMSPARLLIADLMRAFPREVITEERLDSIMAELEDLDASVLATAVRVLKRTHEFFPTIRAIREACAELTLQLPSESAALTQVEQRITWGHQQHGDAPPIHPLVKTALDAVGGFWAFRAHDQPAVVRSQFLRLYKDMRAGAIREHQVGQLALDAAPARRELTA